MPPRSQLYALIRTVVLHCEKPLFIKQLVKSLECLDRSVNLCICVMGAGSPPGFLLCPCFVSCV